MKKFFSLLLVIFLIFGCIGCSCDEDPSDNEGENTWDDNLPDDAIVFPPKPLK